MTRLRESEGDTHFAREPSLDQLSLLPRRAEVLDHDHVREVPHHAVLRLQIVEQAQALAREVFPYHRHPQVASAAVGVRIRPAVLPGQREAVEACFVGEPYRSREQLFPFVAREPAVVPVRARVLASVVEEAVVVGPVLEREDFARDEGVELGEVVLERRRDGEIHLPPRGIFDAMEL